MSCDFCDKVAEHKLVCSVCRSRTYCGKACQKADWKRVHKGQCKELAAARQKLESKGVKLKSGNHPELDRLDNVVTGERPSKMRPPQSYEHRDANIRQSIAPLLRKVNKNCALYSKFAYELGEAMFCPVPWSEYQRELISMQGFGVSTTEARVVLDYREGAYDVGKAEVLSLGPTSLDSLFVPTDRNTTSMMVAPGEISVSDNAVVAVASSCSKLVDVRLQFQPDVSAASMLKLVQSNPNLSSLDLTGCPEAIDDAVLSALAHSCSSLQFLAFGCDNLYLPPLAVSSDALAMCARSCCSLRILRILHCTLSGDPSDPEGAVAQALLGCGLSLRKCIDAEEFCEGLKNSQHYWRAAVESGTLSACWFERGTA